MKQNTSERATTMSIRTIIKRRSSGHPVAEASVVVHATATPKGTQRTPQRTRDRLTTEEMAA